MSSKTQHLRGTGSKPGALRMIVPSMVVEIVGRTIRGKDPLYRVKLESGLTMEALPEWLGGKDLAEKAWEDQRAELQRRQNIAQDQQRMREAARTATAAAPELHTGPDDQPAIDRFLQRFRKVVAS
jgi:hypothetical protein